MVSCRQMPAFSLVACGMEARVSMMWVSVKLQGPHFPILLHLHCLFANTHTGVCRFVLNMEPLGVMTQAL